MKKMFAIGTFGVILFLFNGGLVWAGIFWENDNYNYGVRVEFLKSNSPALDAAHLENSNSSEYQAALEAREKGYSMLYFVRFSVFANSSTPPDQYFSGDHTVHLSTTDELLTIPTATGGWSSNQQRIVYEKFYYDLNELNADFENCTVTFNVNFNNSLHPLTVQVNTSFSRNLPDFQVGDIIDYHTIEVQNIVNADFVWVGMYTLNDTSGIYEEVEQKDIILSGKSSTSVHLSELYGPEDLYFLATGNDAHKGIRFYVYQRGLMDRASASNDGWRYDRNDLAGTNYYENQSLVPTDNNLHEKFTLPGGSGDVLTGDVTGDGFLEIVHVIGNRLNIYDYQGNLLQNVPLESSSCKLTMIADINGDNINDIGIGTSDTADLKSFFYDGSGNLLQVLSKTAGYDSSMLPVGLTADKDFIISFTAGYSHSNNHRGFAVYDKATGEEKWHYKVGPSFGVTSVADFNNDGVLEFTNYANTVHNGCTAGGADGNGTTTTDGDMWLIVVNEYGNEIFSRKYPAPGDGRAKHYFVDLDKNGVMEILGFESHDPRYYQGTSQIHLYDQSGTAIQTFNGMENSSWSFAMADMTGDGIDEVVAVNSSAETQILYILDTNLAERDSRQVDGHVQLVSDINGDGENEVVLLSTSGVITILDSNLNVLDTYEAGGFGRLITSDVDKNGKIDLICLTDDRIHVLENAGDNETPISQTITFAPYPEELAIGGTAYLSATASSDLAVVFSSLTSDICSVSGNEVTGLEQGSCTVAADQPGNAAYNPATRVIHDFDVIKSDQFIHFGSYPANLAIGGISYLSATASSGLAVVFNSLTSDICSVSGSAVTGLEQGTCTVAADQSGNAAYNPATRVTRDLTVTEQDLFMLTKSSPNLTVAAGSQASVYGTAAANDITLESGAKAELINFPGQNSIEFQSDSNLFTVSRSGTIVTFEGSDGTELMIPATDSVQTISFADSAPLILSIHNNQVMLDDQVITTAPALIENSSTNFSYCGKNGQWDEINNYCIGEYGHDSSSVVEQAGSSTTCSGYFKTSAYHYEEQLIALFISNGHCRASSQSFPNWPSENLRDHCIKHGGTGNYLWRYHSDPEWQGNTVGVQCEVDLGSTWDSYNDCGAYIAPGVWKDFDCYNLAAAGKDNGADPFTPSWELIGGYWQWGRKGPDPIQWYDTNTEHFAHGPTGPEAGAANSGDNDGWDSADAPSNTWSDVMKTADDPCPVGFRIPSRSQWEGVMDNNPQGTAGTWSTGWDDHTSYGNARFFGMDLMLPAGGYRHYSTGALSGRGTNGSYWSSAESTGGSAWYMNVYDSYSNTNHDSRRYGCSIRCVAE
jgi:uncharacterized protein (TIGR02145 family)